MNLTQYTTETKEAVIETRKELKGSFWFIAPFWLPILFSVLAITIILDLMTFPFRKYT